MGWQPKVTSVRDAERVRSDAFAFNKMWDCKASLCSKGNRYREGAQLPHLWETFKVPGQGMGGDDNKPKTLLTDPQIQRWRSAAKGWGGMTTNLRLY